MGWVASGIWIKMERKWDPPKPLVGTEGEKEGLVEVGDGSEEQVEGVSCRQCEHPFEEEGTPGYWY